MSDELLVYFFHLHGLRNLRYAAPEYLKYFYDKYKNQHLNKSQVMIIIKRTKVKYLKYYKFHKMDLLLMISIVTVAFLYYCLAAPLFDIGEVGAGAVE